MPVVERCELILGGKYRYLIHERFVYDLHQAIARVIWDCSLDARVIRFVPSDIDRPETYELVMEFYGFSSLSEEIFRQALEAELAIPF